MSSSSSTNSVVSGDSSPPPPNNITEATSVSTNVCCEVERLLVEHSNRWTVLFALCIGLEETFPDGTKKPLIDINETPFCLLKKKDIKPSVDCLREEVKRRSSVLEANKTKLPKPNGWNAQKCIEWLKANPINSDEDIAFLHQKAKEVKVVVENATQKAPPPHGQASNGVAEAEQEIGNKWFGPLPYLRLIHCLLEDDVKDKWLRRNRKKTIQEIDARRSEVREEDVFELIAQRWNSEEFNPTTMISNCHFHFSQEIDIGFQATADFARATPTKVKDKLAKMKTDLSSIIDKWERSGQGDGGVIDEEDEDEDDENQEDSNEDTSSQQPKFQWGRSEGRTGAFDCRDSFLRSYPSYLLYYWDVLDQNDLFDTTFNRMSDEAGASSANTGPSALGTRESADKEVSTFISSIREVIEASKDASIAANRRHEETKQDNERRHRESIEAEDKRVLMKSNAAESRVILQARLDNQGYLKRRIDNLQDEARRVRFKIFECNQNKNDSEKEFYDNELRLIQDEITKCNMELTK